MTKGPPVSSQQDQAAKATARLALKPTVPFSLAITEAAGAFGEDDEEEGAARVEEGAARIEEAGMVMVL
jgi:hypothetical protein